VIRAAILLQQPSKGLVAPGQSLTKHAGSSVWRKPFDRLLGHARKATELSKAPVVHPERLTLDCRQQETIAADWRRLQPWRMGSVLSQQAMLNRQDIFLAFARADEVNHTPPSEVCSA
jgi:hypothetical protein